MLSLREPSSSWCWNVFSVPSSIRQGEKLYLNPLVSAGDRQIGPGQNIQIKEFCFREIDEFASEIKTGILLQYAHNVVRNSSSMRPFSLLGLELITAHLWIISVFDLLGIFGNEEQVFFVLCVKLPLMERSFGLKETASQGRRGFKISKIFWKFPYVLWSKSIEKLFSSFVKLYWLNSTDPDNQQTISLLFFETFVKCRKSKMVENLDWQF